MIHVFRFQLKHKIISAVLTALLVLTAVPSFAYASDAQEQLDETNSEISALESEQAALESSLSSYKSTLSALADELETIVSQIDDKQVEIDEAQEEIDALQVSIEEQEELIRDRAQYVYENNGSSSLQILLTSSSFADFLNKVQYLNDLNDYDQELVDEYNDLCTQMAELKGTLESEMEELETLRDDSLAKQDTMYSLIEETNTQIAANESALASAQAEAAELEAQIEAAQAAANAANAQAAAAESSSSGSSSGSSDSSASSSSSDSSGSSSSSSSSVSASADDVTLLAALIYCEAGGESYAGKLAVGSVVVNRVNSSRFPNTISGVIYQTGQFSPASNGRLASALSSGSYSGDSYSAAQEVLSGNITTSCLYFNSASYYSGSYTMQIGNQVFY